jgi:predicted transcriptional regulator
MKATDTAQRNFVVSVHPTYAQKIVDGEKTVELRRRFVENVAPGAIVLIYSTSPIRAITALAVIERVHYLPIEKIWRSYGRAACICRADFDQYFVGAKRGYAILLGGVKRFRRAVTATDLRAQFGFVPPQSYRYLPQEYYSLLDHEQLQASY